MNYRGKRGAQPTPHVNSRAFQRYTLVTSIQAHERELSQINADALAIDYKRDVLKLTLRELKKSLARLNSGDGSEAKR